MALHHIVLFRFQPHATLEQRLKATEMLKALGTDCGGYGLLLWKVGSNEDLRKGISLVQLSIFADRIALDTFKKHPKHKEVTDYIKDFTDWYVGDIHH